MGEKNTEMSNWTIPTSDFSLGLGGTPSAAMTEIIQTDLGKKRFIWLVKL